MNFLTYHNHGDLGFADAINRIDILTRLANKHGLQFALPDLSTVIHNNNYLIEFGLQQYKFHSQSLPIIQTVEIKLNDFFSDFDFKSYEKCLFVIKNFDYNLAGKLSRTVSEFDSFPFRQFYKIQANPENSLDVVIHLRMGDRYVYCVNDRFVCPWKYVYSNSDQRIIDEFNRQWSIEKLKTVIHYFEKNGIKYRLFSDGIGSAVKTLKTYHGWSSVDPSEIDNIIGVLQEFENDFLTEFKDCNLNYAGSKISDMAEAIVHTKKIVFTEGGLASSLNKFYNKERATSQSFTDLHNTILA
jgi:hypothetical protein